MNKKEELERTIGTLRSVANMFYWLSQDLNHEIKYLEDRSKDKINGQGISLTTREYEHLIQHAKEILQKALLSQWTKFEVEDPYQV